ncbi:GNAT family N-acetyltransferase [Nocardia sp. NPDC051463]|uniref:GNAT family N-acetyltransferase n=1 Tax=Nocardia sp. NPDC051463 TaxID=3154845 RepID=UPI00342BA211
MDNKIVQLFQKLKKIVADMFDRKTKMEAESVERFSEAAKLAAKRLDENDIRAAGRITYAAEPESVRTMRSSGTPSRSTIGDPHNRLPSEYLDLTPDEVGPAIVGPAQATHGPGIARAHVLASRAAYLELLEAIRRGDVLLADLDPRMIANWSKNLDDFLLADLGPRKIVDWSRLAMAGEPGLWTACTADNTVAGLIWVSTRDDGAGMVNAWYVHPNWHGTGVGRDLMRTALGRLGNVDVYTQTTMGTTAVARYERYGFKIFGERGDTPPPLRHAGLCAPQVTLKLSSKAAGQ